MTATPKTFDGGVRTFVTCTALLFLKFFVVLFIQARKSGYAGMRVPEDDQMNHSNAMPSQNYGLMEVDPSNLAMRKAREEDARWRRIVTNDLETLPIALIIFGMGYIVTEHKAMLIATMVVFTVARFLFTIVYAAALQPYRTVMYALAAVAVTVNLVDTVVTVLK